MPYLKSRIRIPKPCPCDDKRQRYHCHRRHVRPFPRSTRHVGSVGQRLREIRRHPGRCLRPLDRRPRGHAAAGPSARQDLFRALLPFAGLPVRPGWPGPGPGLRPIPRPALPRAAACRAGSPAGRRHPEAEARADRRRARRHRPAHGRRHRAHARPARTGPGSRRPGRSHRGRPARIPRPLLLQPGRRPAGGHPGQGAAAGRRQLYPGCGLRLVALRGEARLRRAALGPRRRHAGGRGVAAGLPVHPGGIQPAEGPVPFRPLRAV